MWSGSIFCINFLLKRRQDTRILVMRLVPKAQANAQCVWTEFELKGCWFKPHWVLTQPLELNFIARLIVTLGSKKENVQWPTWSEWCCSLDSGPKWIFREPSNSLNESLGQAIPCVSQSNQLIKGTTVNEQQNCCLRNNRSIFLRKFIGRILPILPLPFS